jgi:hypothetical protein
MSSPWLWNVWSFDLKLIWEASLHYLIILLRHISYHWILFFQLHIWKHRKIKSKGRQLSTIIRTAQLSNSKRLNSEHRNKNVGVGVFRFFKILILSSSCRGILMPKQNNQIMQWTNWPLQKLPLHMTLKIKVLVRNRHKNVAALNQNQLMDCQPHQNVLQCVNIKTSVMR